MRRVAGVLIIVTRLSVWRLLPNAGLNAAAAPPEAEPAEQNLAIIVNSVEPGRQCFLSGSAHDLSWGTQSLAKRPAHYTVHAGARSTRTQGDSSDDFYRMNESDFSRHFLQGLFTGEVRLPQDSGQPVGVRSSYSNVPGAIGYVRAADVDDTVKVFGVDGHLPTIRNSLRNSGSSGEIVMRKHLSRVARGQEHASPFR